MAIAVILGVSCFRLNKDKKELEREIEFYAQSQSTTEEETQVAASADESYYLILEDGVITVYHGDGKSIYLQTDISQDSIPVVNLQELKKGIYVQSIKEVYDYLESCSS
jgi:hypothetical protein